MSWQDDAMAEQEAADALNYMGEAEWRDIYEDVSPDHEYEIRKCNKTPEEEDSIRREDLRRMYYAEYWKKNKNRLSKIRKENYKKNKDKILTKNRKWLKDNRERWNAYQREYRRRKKAELDKSDRA